MRDFLFEQNSAILEDLRALENLLHILGVNRNEGDCFHFSCSD